MVVSELKFYKNLLQNGFYWNRGLKEKENYARKNEIKAFIKPLIKKQKFKEINDYFKNNNLNIYRQNWNDNDNQVIDQFLSDTDDEE